MHNQHNHIKVICQGHCTQCRRLFIFDPAIVPSMTDGHPWDLNPICRNCVDQINRRRLAQRLPLIVPLGGSYEQAEGRN